MIIKRLLRALKRQDFVGVAIELLLVVFGILIALQIDNLNQERKQQLEINSSLAQIASDLKQDEEVLKSFQSSNEMRVLYLQRLAAGSYEEIDLTLVLKNLDDYFYFYKSNNSYSGLKESLLFPALKNVTLKNGLTEYYEQTYERLRVASDFGEKFTNDRVTPFVLDNFTFDDNHIVNDEALVKQLMQETNLRQLVIYQVGVKQFSLNLMRNAIDMNMELRAIIEKQVASGG